MKRAQSTVPVIGGNQQPRGTLREPYPAASPDRYLFYGLLALMVWLPLPFGSNRPWAWHLMEVWVFLLAAMWLLGYLKTWCELTPAFKKAWMAWTALALWLAFVLFQFIPIPYAGVEALSPEAARIHSQASLAQETAPVNLPFTDFASHDRLATLSVDPYATANAWLKSLAYSLVFVLTLLLVRTRTRVRQLAYVLVLSGLFQAVYGSLMTLSGVELGFFIEKYTNVGVATGTFVNRNHLAGYLEMCLSLGIGLTIASLDTRNDYSWRQRFRNWTKLMFSRKMQIRVYLAVMVVALVLTRSRMGNTAFFASLLISGSLGLALSRHATRPTVILLSSLLVIDLFIVGAWFGVDKVIERIEQTEIRRLDAGEIERQQDIQIAGGFRLPQETRDEVDIYSLDLWHDYLWIGSGAGSYYSAFPRYRQADVGTAFYEHAHNDYIEFLTETGIVGTALAGFVLIMSLVTAIIAQYKRRDPLMRGMSFATIMGTTSLLIHSTVDFNLQIPANAATFMVVLALGWISSAISAGAPAPES